MHVSPAFQRISATCKDLVLRNLWPGQLLFDNLQLPTCHAIFPFSMCSQQLVGYDTLIAWAVHELQDDIYDCNEVTGWINLSGKLGDRKEGVLKIQLELLVCLKWSVAVVMHWCVLHDGLWETTIITLYSVICSMKMYYLIMCDFTYIVFFFNVAPQRMQIIINKWIHICIHMCRSCITCIWDKLCILLV